MSNTSKRPFDTGSNAWMVSFGDLLTLLLCFFISIISLSPLNPAASSSQDGINASSDGTNLPIEAPQQRITSSGTQLAEVNFISGKAGLPLGEVVLAFSGKDFSPYGGELLGDGQKAIKSLFAEGSYLAGPVVIESCSTEFVGGSEIAFEKAARRAASLKRHLIDTRPAAEFRFRNAGSRCSALPGADSAKWIEAVVRVNLKNG
ncbi:MAG: flagellar motor protein MotB [Deltaproteobacteria bacterium]|nr:flagellar motor protein MotB [Deltaproteobacteria bacterium]